MAAPVDYQVLNPVSVPVSVSSSEEKNQMVVNDGRSYQVKSSRDDSTLEIVLMALGMLGLVVGGMLLTVASGGAAPVGVLYAGIISMSVAAVCGTPFFIETIFQTTIFVKPKH